MDIGCGQGVDDLWLARQGASVIGFDYALRGSVAVAGLAADEEVDLDFRSMNLCELRSVLTESARIAQLPGRTVVTARHVADATDTVGRGHLWRACEMMLRGGGRLYLEILLARGDGRPVRPRGAPARRCAMRRVVGRAGGAGRGRGAPAPPAPRRYVQSPARGPDGSPGHRIGRLVVEWQR